MPLPPPYNPNIRIAGVEVTQGIQYFDLTSEGSAGYHRNSVPLVDNKTTVLRVYPDCLDEGDPGYDPNFDTPRYITADLEVPLPMGVDSSVVNVLNDRILAESLARTSRRRVDDTLNFRIPAWLCTRHVPATVQIHDEDRHREYSAPLRLMLSFLRYNTPTGQEITDYRLRLFVVRIIYTGPDATGQPTRLGPPSEQDMVATLSHSFVSRTFPVSGINYTGSTIAEFNGDLRSSGVGCGAGWSQLLAMLRGQRAASSSTDVVLGLLPDRFATPQVPRNNVTGCGANDGVAAAFVGDSHTVAHELGHAYGRDHAPCGNPTNVDPTYPTYLGCPSGTACPSGSIGEWGFGTTFSTIISPHDTFDFMGNACDPTWVSPYTYVALRDAILRRDWQRAPNGVALALTLEAAVEREYLYLNFRAYRDGRVELLPSFHLPGAAPVPETEDGRQSRVVCELRDAEGRVIGFHRCHLTDPNVDPDSPYRDYHEMVPWESETRSIRFLRDGEEIDEVEVEQQAPQITAGLVTELDDQRNRMRLEWEGQHETESVTYLVRYSNDGGENWIGVAASLTEPRFEVDLDTLPGGERCVFQIVASSTIRTTVAETDPVSVPVKPRRPIIVFPEPGSTFLQGESMVLAGVGYSPDFETAPPTK